MADKLMLDVNVDNEQVVLAALIKDPALFERELPSMRAEWFNLDKHQDVLNAFRAVRAAGAGYSADTVVQLSGGRVALKYLLDLERSFDALTPENFQIHVNLLQQSAVKYGASEAFTELYATLDDPHVTVEETECAALAVLKRLREGVVGTRGSLRFGRKLRREWCAELANSRAEKSPKFRQTYYRELDDELYEGFAPGKLVVIAARPAMGKSTFCANLALRQAVKGRKVLFAPLEAGTDATIDQMVCSLARVEARKLIKDPQSLTDEEMLKLGRAARLILDNDNLRFDDEITDLDQLELRVEEEEYDLVIVDLFEYLIQGKLEPAIVTDNLRRFRKLARRRRFAGVGVQQIRRTKRLKNRRPLLSELKNSGGYEEVPDLVLLLHRDKYYDPDSAATDVMEIKIAKQRRGAMNRVVGYEFLPEFCALGDYTTDHAGNGYLDE